MRSVWPCDPGRPTRRTHIRTAAVATAALTALAGCVRVDPKPDYHQAGRFIGQRTSAAAVYDPSDPDAAEARVQTLLAGGLTVDEAVEVALLNNRAFQSAMYEIGISRARLVQAGLVSNPSLFVSLRFPEGGGRSNLTLSLAQQLVDLWQIPVRKRIAKLRLAQTMLTIARTAVELRAEAETRAWRLLALRVEHDLARRDLQLAERSVQLARDRFNAGEAGKLDVMLARAEVLAARQRLVRIEGELRRERAGLGHVLGLARRTDDWRLVGALPEGDAALPQRAALLELALRQRADAQAALLEFRSARAQIREQVLKILPNVTLGAELERPERRALPGRKVLADTARASLRSGRLSAPDIETRGERNLERRQIIDSLLGPTLEITLPIWHQNQPQIAKARYRAEQLRRRTEDLLDSIARDVQQAIAAAETAAELVRTYRDEILPLARQNVEAARRAYRAGEQSILALLDAQKSLIARRQAFVQARRDYAIALAALRRAIGGPLPAPATQPASGPASQPHTEDEP